MSTPCNIAIYETAERADKDDWDVLLYVHHDGYPKEESGGMLEPLEEFVKRFTKYHRDWNSAHMGARLIQRLTNAYDEHMAEIYMALSSVDEEDYAIIQEITRTLSFGISKTLGGGIKWLYKIYPMAIEVWEVTRTQVYVGIRGEGDESMQEFILTQTIDFD